MTRAQDAMRAEFDLLGLPQPSAWRLSFAMGEVRVARA